MKKQLLSLSLVLCLILNTFSPSAVEISFEDFAKQNVRNEDFYIDEHLFQESKNLISEEENILEDVSYLENVPIFEDTSLKAKTFTTENLFSEQRITLLNSENNENPIKNLSIPENLNYTMVDITDIFTGNIISHDCNLYLISNFDEEEHWNECSVCEKILNKEEHDYIDNGWTEGTSNNCYESNVHMFICDCGASYNTIEGRKSHRWGEFYSHPNYYYERICQDCPCTDMETRHNCEDLNGNRINCSNLGICALCGYDYSKNVLYHYGDNIARNSIDEMGDYGNLGDVHCYYCNKLLGTVNNIEFWNTSDGTYKYRTYLSINGSYSLSSTYNFNGQNQLSNASYSRSGLTATSTTTYHTHTESTSCIDHVFIYSQNGESCRIDIYGKSTPESTPPVITNIATNSLGNWTTDSTISITGTENYCNSVNLTLKDTEGNIYTENVIVPVNNKNWNYEVKPSLESKDKTEFILQVSDPLDNTTEQSFYLSKIDAIPPKAIETETLNTAWSKTKDYVLTSSDYGIGNVSNSVIDTNNYELATEKENIFYKGYTFTGDVYGETLVPVYMKDGLGNSNVEFVSISNLDNTSPTIENVELNKTLHNTEITISANDINEKLNATGSGVTGYAISTENEIPQTFQEENTFNISEAGNYYIFVTDLVGNVTSKEIYISVQYKVTIDPDEGTWKGDTNPKEYITDEPINLYPEPEKEGYIFKEWKIDGEGSITEDGELIISGDVTVTPIWEANTYPVTFIDYDVTKKEELKKITKELTYNTLINGFDIGSDTTDNTYYPQYRLISSTEIKVSTNSENNVVYRYFEFCYTEKESHINFNDNNNADGLRPETYKLQLILEDGKLIDEVILPTSQTDYTFTNLPKYDEQGEEYNYKIVPIISDRYTPEEPDKDGNITIIYNNPSCNIFIPKVTTLDGKYGNLTYTIQVDTNLFYKDKIILIPEKNITLTDGIRNIPATVTQNKTEFNKEDELTITGRIQVTKKHFAGTWKGTFNFKIKYEVSN